MGARLRKDVAFPVQGRTQRRVSGKVMMNAKSRPERKKEKQEGATKPERFCSQLVMGQASVLTEALHSWRSRIANT
jgi:hypothetical protein